MISIQRGLPAEGKAWNIEHIYRAPFGDALLSLLVSRSFGSIENILKLIDKLGSAGVLQPLLQPYFPEWRNNLPISQWTFREGTCIFKVSWGKVWLRIAIRAALSLDILATAILNAVRFSKTIFISYHTGTDSALWKESAIPFWKKDHGRAMSQWAISRLESLRPCYLILATVGNLM